MKTEELIALEVKQLADELLEKGWRVTAAESLTGGMICSGFVDVPGSSQWFSEGFVTYSDTAKHELLGVDENTIKAYTAVSDRTAAEMAVGARKRSGAEFSVAVTGLAGPGADEYGREPGLVYVAIACKSGYAVKECRFNGDRTQIRKMTNLEAVRMLKRMVRSVK